MKTYDFKTLVWAVCCMLIYFSVFIYGLVWLNEGFKVEKDYFKMRSEFKQEINRLENSLMPSSFKGVKNAHTHSR